MGIIGNCAKHREAGTELLGLQGCSKVGAATGRFLGHARRMCCRKRGKRKIVANIRICDRLLMKGNRPNKRLARSREEDETPDRESG